MTIQIAKVFPEDIEKNFRNHLPTEAVTTLIQLALSQHDAERAMNEMMRIIQELLKVTTISTQQVMSIRSQMDKFASKYDGSNLVNSEHLKS